LGATGQLEILQTLVLNVPRWFSAGNCTPVI